LVEIVRFIAQDDPPAAIRFGDYLIDRAESLANFPELGMPYRQRPNVRRLLCKSYYIYYRVRRAEQVIEIMDYWHAARREPPF
jgi:plasmid stabilization system protein ParE